MSRFKTLCLSVLTAAFCVLFAFPAVISGEVIGIVALDAPSPNAENMREIVRGLGYEPKLITGEMLAEPGRLGSFDCIVLTHRHSNLIQDEYEALARYVREGGALFMTGHAAYWMYEDPDDRMGAHRSPRRAIHGRGPFEEVTGARIILPHQGRVEKFRVVERNSYTEGLPDEFSYETRPPYDVRDEASVRRTWAYRIRPGTAATMIESEAYYEEVDPETGEREYNMEETVTASFLTVNHYGEGRCVWLACRVTDLVLDRSERNILGLVANVLRSIMD